MKGIQFILLMVTSSLAVANPTANDVIPSKSKDEDFKMNPNMNCECKCKTTLHCENVPFSRPVDCDEVRLNGNVTSGVYTIFPRSRQTSSKSIKVYCDMKDGAGWTVLQRRGQYGNAPNYFNKTWETYKHGFGQLEREFWLGNEMIFALTNQGSYSVRFDIRHVNGTSAFALYDHFWIDDEERKYQLNIAGYSGDAGDSMSHHHLMKFSTQDSENGAWASSKCAAIRTGGWWFKECGLASLNGLNILGKYNTNEGNRGIIWQLFAGPDNSLEFSEIKIRPMFFR